MPALPTQVTRRPRINDECQELDFYIQECKELFKRLEKSIEQEKKLSEVNCDLVSEQKKLSKVNCDLRDKIERIKISISTHSFGQVIAQNEKLKTEIEELKKFNAFVVSTLNDTGYFFQPL